MEVQGISTHGQTNLAWRDILCLLFGADSIQAYRYLEVIEPRIIPIIPSYTLDSGIG